jgi:hypothetical protein
MNFGMIASYLKAKWSKGVNNKKADVTTKDLRLISCFGDGENIPVCPGLRASKEQRGKFFCGECGCGDRRATWLNTDDTEYGKLDHPYLNCPRKMPGFSNYEPGGDSRKTLIEIKIGDDVMRSEIAKPVHPNLKEEPTQPEPQPEPEPEKKPCPACQNKKKKLIELSKQHDGAVPQEEINRVNEEYEIEKKGGCVRCEQRRKQMEQIRNSQ